MKSWETHRGGNLEQVTAAAAQFLATLAARSIDKHEIFTLALSGGSTPRTLYKDLATSPYDTAIPWTKTHLFWGDERFVPRDHPDSNYAMANEALISNIPISKDRVHAVPVELESAEEAARTYETRLRRFFGSATDAETPVFPAFDCILLGMGTDGHTASLFPHDQALQEQTRWVTSVPHPAGDPAVPRITFTLPLINAARCVIFLVSGQSKRNVLQVILDDIDKAAKIYPAARVRPQGTVHLFHD